MTENIWIALIGLAGVVATAIATLLGVLLKREKDEAKTDRATAEEMRTTLRLEVSVADSSGCSHSSCPKRSAATLSPAPTAAPAGDPRSANPNPASDTD